MRLLVLCAVAALIAPITQAVQSQQQLHLDRSGRLSAVPSKSGSSNHPRWRTFQPLFPVKVNFDVSEMDVAKGLTVVYDKPTQALRVEQVMKPGGGIAWGRFSDNIDQTGWSELHVQTSDDQNSANDVKVYAAGYIEGLMTSVRMSEFYANTQKNLLQKDETASALSSIRALFRDQLDYLRSKTNMEHHVFVHEPDDDYWKHARYVLCQMWGVLDGYNAAVARFGGSTLELEDMMVINTGGELPTLMEAYGPVARHKRSAQVVSFLQKSARSNQAPLQEDPLDNAHWEKRVAETGKCSALIRLADGDKDLLLGHSTWDDYSKMTRIFKYYNFSLPASGTVSSRIAMSSYPGAVTSTDEFYVMSSGLTVMDTSLEILDSTLWNKILQFPAYKNIPNFVHLMIANRMAKGAPDWAKLYSRTNTGTRTSQWMVVDYNQFSPTTGVQDNAFWLVEMVPGMTEMRDMTNYLREKRYFPSFNRPFFGKVRETSGHEGAQRSHGMLYSWHENPRAQIFAAAQTATNALSDMRALMDRNAYPNSGPLSDPGHDISARMDLSPVLKIPNGGIDAKVVNHCLARKLQVQAISGPSHQTLNPFHWVGDDQSDLWPDYPHAGQPDVWNFSYVQFTEDASLLELTDESDCYF
jgi:hypothetical protein